MILGAVQVVVNVAALGRAEAPLLAAGFARSFAEPRLASHPAKAMLLSGPRDALAMVHLTPPHAAPATELTSYGAPGGTAAYALDDGGVLVTTTDDRDASGAFWDALAAPEGDGVRRFRAALPAWRLELDVVDGPSRAGATTVDADGCVLVSLVCTNAGAELARLERRGVLRGRATDVWDETVDGRALRVAIVEGPAGELVELLQIPSAP